MYIPFYFLRNVNRIPIHNIQTVTHVVQNPAVHMVITALIFFFLWFVLLFLPSQHILLTAQQTVWRYTYKIKYRFTPSDCMHNGLKFGVKHSGKRGQKRINGRSRQFVKDPELHAAIQSGEEEDPMFSWKLWYGVSEAPIFKTLKAMTKRGGGSQISSLDLCLRSLVHATPCTCTCWLCEH